MEPPSCLLSAYFETLQLQSSTIQHYSSITVYFLVISLLFMHFHFYFAIYIIEIQVK